MSTVPGNIFTGPSTRTETPSISCCAPTGTRPQHTGTSKNRTEHNGVPKTVTIDQSWANLAALKHINASRERPIRIRQSKYLNNIVEQAHCVIKGRTRPMMGFKDLHCATHPARRHRDDAHDRQRADEGRSQEPDTCRAILFSDCIRNPIQTDTPLAGDHYRDRTHRTDSAITHDPYLLDNSSAKHTPPTSTRRRKRLLFAA